MTCIEEGVHELFSPTAKCKGGCRNGSCVAPNRCQCEPGFAGPNCRKGKSTNLHESRNQATILKKPNRERKVTAEKVAIYSIKGRGVSEDDNARKPKSPLPHLTQVSPFTLIVVKVSPRQCLPV